MWKPVRAIVCGGDGVGGLAGLDWKIFVRAALVVLKRGILVGGDSGLVLWFF